VRRIRRGRHVDPRAPRGYYIDYSELADPRGPLDAEGLPRLPSAVDGLAHSALDLARFALGNLEIYLDNGSLERRERFRLAVERLVAAMERVPASFGGWALPPGPRAYRSQLPTARFAAGTQGECLSALVRAWTLLNLEEAGEAAAAAFAAFTAPVDDGGLMREVGDASGDAGTESPIFLEEYPIAERVVMDLSGHCRGALGIYDYWKASGDVLAGPHLRRSIAGLEFVLDMYDLGYWTRDDLDARRRGGSVSSIASLREHVLHLSSLSELAGSVPLGEAARGWAGYLSRPWFCLRAMRARVVAGLAGRALPGPPVAPAIGEARSVPTE